MNFFPFFSAFFLHKRQNIPWSSSRPSPTSRARKILALSVEVEQQKIMVLGFTEQQVQVEQAGTRNGRVIDFGVSATFDETSAFVDGLVPYGDIP